VKLPELTLAQKPDALAALADGTSGYVGWLGETFAQRNGHVRETLLTLRTKAQNNAQHPRVPEILAHLQVGWVYGMRFAVETGAVTRQEADQHVATAWTTLLAIGQEQGAVVQERQPHRLYLRALSDLLQMRRAILLRSDIAPEAVAPKDLPMGAEILGWYDDDHIYLVPLAAYQAVSRMYRNNTGALFPVPEDQVERFLQEHGVSVRTEGIGRERATVGGKQRRGLKLARRAIETEIGSFDVPTMMAPGEAPDDGPF
jgi:hypothetical protein